MRKQKKPKVSPCLPSSPLPTALPCPRQEGLCVLPEEAVMKTPSTFTVYGRRTLENRHGYRPRSASIRGPQGAGGKHRTAAPDAAQPGIIIKKCLHHRRNCFSNSKGKMPGLMRLLHRILAGLFLSLPLPPDPLLFRVVLNQAKGADDKTQLGVGSFGGTPRLSVAPHLILFIFSRQD